MFNNHLMKACLAAVFAIGLAACSSSSDTSSTTPDPAPDPGPTQAEQDLEELQNEIAALRAQLGITDDADIGDSIDDLMAERDRLQMQIDDAEDEAERKAVEAAAATAAKLYAGISAPSGDNAATATGTRSAAYDGDDIDVRIVLDADGDGTADDPIDATLSEDEDTMVAANRGWAGKRYADAPGGDMVEAYVYSNVEAPTMGKKFGSVAAGLVATGPYEYQLSATGVLTPAEADGIGGTGTTFVATRVAIDGVTRTAGTETFELPEGRPQGEDIINRAGSYHGVRGTYSCDTNDGADACTAAVAARGLTLAGTWTFKPSNAEARVMDSADIAYASYGWWIRKAENDGPFQASVFTGRVGAAPDAVAIADLRGTATYSGGAAGKYALSSSTGGTNDAGHFTADVELQATFGEDHSIKGTVDGFTGADGMSRDWSVALSSSTVSDTGVIAGDPNTAGNTDAQMTVWTMGGVDGDASGQWSGNLAEAGDDTVPTVATGTFYSEFGRGGKLVGAFGANLD